MFPYPVVWSRFVGAEKERKEDVILKHDWTLFYVNLADFLVRKDLADFLHRFSRLQFRAFCK
jgi:hypothetical protein